MDNSVDVYLAAVTGSANNTSIFSLLWDSDIIVKFILLVLMLMSFACWAIIFGKFLRLYSASRQSARFLELFWNSKRLDSVYEQVHLYKNSPVAKVFEAGYQELSRVSDNKSDRDDGTDNVMRTLRRASTVQMTSLQRYITFLGTTGSTAPFIGLLGTVWGILRAFQKLGGGGQATIDVVGPDIAHALIATAVGLAAAIPAVIAFNYFNRSIFVMKADMENFSSDFLNIVKRHLR